MRVRVEGEGLRLRVRVYSRGVTVEGSVLNSRFRFKFRVQELGFKLFRISNASNSRVY